MGMPKRHRGLVIRLSLLLVLGALLGVAARSRQASQHMQQAQVALASGLPSQASQHLVEAARRLPWRSDLWELAGRYALQAGDYPSAIASLERANQEGHLSPQGLIDLGDAYQGSGDPHSAKRAWKAAYSAGSDPDQLARRLALSDMAQGNYAAAIARLQALSATQPEDADIYYQLGLMLAAQDPQAALEPLQRAAELDPALASPAASVRRSIIGARFADDPAYSLLSAGRALASLGRWDLAFQAFRCATQVRPDYAEAWAYLGEAHQHLAGQADPTASGEPHADSGLSGGNLADDGLAELQIALELDPQSLAAHTFLSLYWSRRGRADLAVSSIQEAMQLDPDNPYLQVELADALARSGDLEAAYQALQDALNLAPSDPIILRRVVELLLHYEFRLEEFALPVARRLVILDPQDPAILDVMGQVLTRLGDLVSAERFLERALQADPNYAPAHLHLGMLHILRSNRAQALIELQLASAMDPGSPAAEQARRILETYFP